MKETMTGGKNRYKRHILLFACLVLFAGGCDNNPVVERVYTPYDSDPDWWSYDEPWEEAEDEDGGIPVSVKKQVSIDAVSGLSLGDEDSRKAGAEIATLTLPPTFGIEMPEEIESNCLFTIVDGRNEGANTGTVKIVIKEDITLDFDVYRVIIKIAPNDGINAPFVKKIEFAVAKTPPPFRNAPTVYPYITAPRKNKLTVTWNESPVTAKNFQVYVSTDPDNGKPYGSPLGANVRTFEITDIVDDDTADGLPDGTTYYIWLTALNDDGESPFGPPGVRSTSFTLHESFYKDPDGNDFYSWDSYSGDGGSYINGISTHKGGRDMYIISPPSDEYPCGFSIMGLYTDQ